MAEHIISASGIQYGMIVNSDGSINTITNIGSISFSGTIIVDDVNGTMYMVSGNAWSGIGSSLVTNLGSESWVKEIPIGSNYIIDTLPNASIKYNPKIVIVYSGTAIGSIYKNLSTGSILQVLSYDAGDKLIGVSAWSAV